MRTRYTVASTAFLTVMVFGKWLHNARPEKKREKRSVSAINTVNNKKEIANTFSKKGKRGEGKFW